MFTNAFLFQGKEERGMKALKARVDKEGEKSWELVVRPIGIIRTPYQAKYAAPRQPASSTRSTIGVIELNAGMNFEQALEDVDGFDYIWVLFRFHQNHHWKPKVLPPNSGRIKRGVFATRSPHRPNFIGLSLCRLLEVCRRTLKIENPDMLDGTPVLDIKPYIPRIECFPKARSGWIAEMHDQTPPQFRVTLSRKVEAAIRPLEQSARNEISEYLHSVLGRDPYPHAYRRIKSQIDGTFVIALKRWRFKYRIAGTLVHVFDARRV